jgi:tetratricopeptide (TPR) repeat protein
MTSMRLIISITGLTVLLVVLNAESGTQECYLRPVPKCILPAAAKKAMAIQDADLHTRAVLLVAIAQADTGYPQEAIATLRTLRADDPNAIMRMRREAFSRPLEAWYVVLDAVNQAGDTQRALQMASRVQDDIRVAIVRARALRAVAAAQARRGDVAAAVRTVLQIPADEPDEQATAMGDIGAALVDRGDASGALRLLLWVNKNRRHLASGQIADALVRAGQLGTALGVARGLDVVDVFKDGVFQDIAFALVEAGDLQEAQNIGEGISDPFLRRQSLGEVATARAVARAKAGDERGALEALREVQRLRAPDMFASDHSIRRVAATLARVGRAVAARQLVQEVTSTSDRLELLLDIAAIQAKSGARAGAEETISAALEIAGNERDDGYRAESLAAIARVQMDIGDAQTAANTWRRLATEWPFKEVGLEGEALGVFRAVGQAKRGHLLEAVKAVDSMKSLTPSEKAATAVGMLVASVSFKSLCLKQNGFLGMPLCRPDSIRDPLLDYANRRYSRTGRRPD